MSSLSSINTHSRDEIISFDPIPHVYSIKSDPNSLYTSVTTWVHSHFSNFNADIIINKMIKSKNWINNKYYGMSSKDIKKLWNDNRDSAANLGTILHYDIECYYNDTPHNNNTLEFTYFKNFTHDFPSLKPFRTEWNIWDYDLKIAGSVDMVFQNDDGTIMIYDWKRCKEINKHSSFNKFAITPCIEHLPDTNYWHYTLQLNIYKFIIEKNYAKIVSHLRIVVLHPNNKNYIIHNLPILQNEIHDLINLRINTLLN